MMNNAANVYHHKKKTLLPRMFYCYDIFCYVAMSAVTFLIFIQLNPLLFFTAAVLGLVFFKVTLSDKNDSTEHDNRTSFSSLFISSFGVSCIAMAAVVVLCFSSAHDPFLAWLILSMLTTLVLAIVRLVKS